MKSFCVAGVADYVDVLVAELAYYAVHTATLYAYTCAYRVDAVVEALYCYLGALARDAGDAFKQDESVVNLRHLNFKQTAEEFRACARNYHLRVVVGVLYFLDDGADGFALAVTVARNLLFLREDELVVLLVKTSTSRFQIW